MSGPHGQPGLHGQTGGPGQPPGAPGTGRPDTGGLGHPPGPPRRRRRIWAAVAAVLLAAALPLAAASYVLHRSSGGSAASTSAPANGGQRTAGASRPGNTTPHTATQSTQALISVEQIFPRARVMVDRLRFTRVATELDKNCSVAANGAFAAALKKAGCQRVARVTFADSAKTYAVTVGVAQMPRDAGAQAADRARRFRHDIWFTGLNGPPGSGASAVSRTVAMGYDLLDHRFVVYALAAYCDGRNPAGKTTEVRTLTRLARAFTALAVPGGSGVP